MSTELAPQRHAKYYFEDGNVVFLVRTPLTGGPAVAHRLGFSPTNDNTLFRLHRSILKRNSVFFNDMFEYNHVPTKNEDGEKHPIDGSSDETPIQLGGAPLLTLRDAELELICKALYDMCAIFPTIPYPEFLSLLARPVTPLSELDTAETVALLQVSTKFQFEMIHKKAVERLEDAPLLPLQRYSLALDCLVDHWFLRAYVDMCSLADYPPAPELLAEFSRRNDPKIFWDLMKLREEYRTRLLVYTYGSDLWPYGTSGVVTVCSKCLGGLKSLLGRIISTDGTSDLAGASRDSLPFLKDRLAQGIQPRPYPPLNVCQSCRAQEQAVAAQLLGFGDLEAEVKKVVSPIPS
ncbi:hypothetical protein FRC10_009952 [Ceratobasidium sp. 414]|nr:hypothetical protein FRC10_009952 [Ceratobasidium sp. 414]